MIRTLWKPTLSVALSFSLTVNPALLGAQSPQPPQSSETQAPPPAADAAQAAPLSADQLQQLVAPIALYPDALIAQILGAATFPDQVTAANDWLQQNKSLTGTALSQTVDKQPWDPSVKALTQFPSVLDNLTKNLSWTSALGEGYHNQAADVMTAIQTLRTKAKAAGNLKSGTQITVVQQSPDVIVIQPANPQIVYVPQYNPTVVYGTPVETPEYSTAAVVATGLIAFGVGIAVGAAINNNCCGWGYSYWNCNWHGGAVVYRSNFYYGNNAWHGGVYGSSVTAYGPYGAARAGVAYNSNTGTYARGAAVATPYGAAGAAQAYNPNTGAYAATHQVANAYGNAGSSVVSKNGQTAYTQHQTTAAGSIATVETSQGGRGAAATGRYGNSAAAAQTANGDKYAAANGNVYKNTGNGWQQTQGTASRGYGAQQQPERSSALGGGGNGWQSRQASARGRVSGGGGFRHR